MKKGDIVKFKRVVDPGDENVRMVLLEDPDGGRVRVQALVDMTIPPTYIYPVEELEPIDINVSTKNPANYSKQK